MNGEKDRMPPSDDPRAAYFDRQAETWDTSGPDVEAAIRRLAELRPPLGLRSGQDLLEVGCGTGGLTGWLADRVRPGRVTAVDFSEQMLARARRKGIEADFRRADVCFGSLGREVYDVAFCFHSFPHFRDQAAALANLAAALKGDGELIVMHLAGSAQIKAFHESVGGAVAGDHLPAQAAWDAMLARAGLAKTQIIDREDLFFLKARRA